MMQHSNISKITSILRKAKEYPNEVIEATVIYYIQNKTNAPFSFQGGMQQYYNKHDETLLSYFERQDFPVEIEFITEFLEARLEHENIVENGIVFTPEYIANYIFDQAKIYTGNIQDPKVIDPGCGCGIFLASAAIGIHSQYGVPFAEVLSKSIYGIELDPDNVRRCEIVLNLLPLIYGESNQDVSLNIVCKDSLKCSWTETFKVEGFDYIIGNPPYVNTHDMSKETAKFLKQNYSTTKSGVYNIFYAFIEQAMPFLSDNGILSYIVPNNFLTIKSATELRKYIMGCACLRRILDFANNMVFKPVRTYNCIIQLTKEQNKEFQYCVMERTEDIEKSLACTEYETMPLEKLDINGWKLIDKETRTNIQIIENQMVSIKECIRTGIATLKDEVYMVDKDELGYCKIINGKRIPIEENLVKRLYKIPDLKGNAELKSICRHIIFPYQKGKSGFEIISEDVLKKEYPNTYAYLLSRKATLDERDKGKPNPVAWYAYGRTQGLNRYGVKLLFPTFANKPRFIYVDDEYALFCNGYAVFENGYFDLDILKRILNSAIMDYYVRNTSYAIEGGYYCYQKKYIERFSIPYLSIEDQEQIRSLSDEALDRFLIELYGLRFDSLQLNDSVNPSK